MEKTCEICNATFNIKPSHYYLRRTCSRNCGAKLKSKEKSGNNHPGWKGGREEHSTGHIKVYCPDHPRAHKGKVFEHRLVMEQHLGRTLKSDEIVHHKNGNQQDNRIENLELMTRAEHINEHREQLQRARGL